MPLDKDPYIYNVITYVWVFGLASLGGLVSYMQKVQQGLLEFNVLNILLEIIRSAFVGVVTFLLCRYLNLDQLLTAAMVGVAGHMGSKAMVLLEDWLAYVLKFRPKGY